MKIEALKGTEFEGGLADLLHQCSIDALVGMPDFILASYLVKCVEALGEACEENRVWRMRDAPDPVRPEFREE